MEKVVIVSAVRTPVAGFQGAFAQIPAPKLGAEVIKEAIKRAGVKESEVDECIMGEVLTAGVGQAPARQAAIYAGLSTSTRCMTVNKVCGSGLKAVMLAADSLQLGHSQIAVAGGQENMSLAPHLLENSRNGYRMGPTLIEKSQGDFVIRQNQGTLKVQNSSGSLQFETNKGNIHLLAFNGRMDGQSQEGNINVSLGKESDLDVQAKAGKVTVNTAGLGSYVNAVSTDGELFLPGALKAARTGNVKSYKGRLPGESQQGQINIRAQEAHVLIK